MLTVISRVVGYLCRRYGVHMGRKCNHLLAGQMLFFLAEYLFINAPDRL